MSRIKLASFTLFFISLSAFSNNIQNVYLKAQSADLIGSKNGVILYFDKSTNIPEVIIKDNKKYIKDSGDVFYVEDSFTGERDYQVRYLLWADKVAILQSNSRAETYQCIMETRLPKNYRDALQTRLNEYDSALLDLGVQRNKNGLQEAMELRRITPQQATLDYCKDEHRWFSPYSNKGINGFSYLKTAWKGVPVKVVSASSLSSAFVEPSYK